MVYITCNYKKSRPRISIAVCEKCKRRTNCPDYRDYIQPPLFADLFKVKTITNAMPRKANRPKRMESEATQITDKSEQLALNL
jgi:hypothetical protein